MAHNLFISHSWAYSNAYDRLIDLLNNANGFQYKNYSVPRNDPIHNAPTASKLRTAIQVQMQYANVVIILAGVYSTYSTWINEEIVLAQTGYLRRKPILAIQPWGAERTSQVVKSAADEVVAWNTNSIVAAIRRLAL